MKKLKVGLIGAGNIAENAHMPAYARCKNAEVISIVDINFERAKKLAAKHSITNVFSSTEEMLNAVDVDAVDICVWNDGHSDVTIAAAKAGKHILCEKPMAMNLDKALEMEKAVKNAGVHFMLAVPNRFATPNQIARGLFDDGTLGDVYYGKTSYIRRRGTPTGWFTDKKTSGGGPIIDIGVHRIDAAWYVMGTPKPVRVSAAVSSAIGDYQTKGVTRWIGTECDDNRFDTEDSGAGVIHFDNGAILLFEASWAINGPEFVSTQIYGSKAGITLEPLTLYGERNGYLSNDNITINKSENVTCNLITHFADCVLNDKPNRFPIDQAVELQKILQGIYDSAEQKREIIL